MCTETETFSECLKRDGYRCIICRSNRAVDVHEILPRSSFGKLNNYLLFVIKNRVCLCRFHHERAHTIKARKEIIEIMKKRYGYTYDEAEYSKYQ